MNGLAPNGPVLNKATTFEGASNVDSNESS